MRKRIASLLLILALCFTLLPTAAFAEGTSVDNWDGSADTSWYTSAPDASEYHISTAEQLAGLAQLVNDKTASVSFEGKTIYLDNDLDLSGFQWTPIGNGDNFVRHFAGTFDGQHHKIMNLYHHYTGDELVRNGLFGVVSDGGTLKNLLVIDADIASNDGSLLAGILADWVNGGTVENCYTSGKIENNVGDKFVGGLIGQCTWSTQVKGCGSDATVISTESDEDHVDTVGGLIGQWENSADSSSITDCWFGGSVSCNNIYSAVGGILGANFENFSGNKPGVIIKNCIVATKNITGAEPGNITWITAVVKTHVTDCIWPDTPPDGVTLDEETYPDNKGNYLAVAKLVVDWDAGTASADPNFDQSSCGTAVSNFTSEDVLTGLRTNAGTGIEWVAGINHPIFAWDVWHIPADYTAVDAAIEKANALNENNYRNFSAVKAALDAVVRDKNITEQSEVDAMAQAIEDAINALVWRSSGTSSPSYPVTIPGKTENGTVTVSTKNATSGSTVTITVKPDDGFKLDELTVIDKNGNELKLTDKGNGKYTFTMPASKVEINAAFVKKVEISPFSDVSTSAYYYEAVKWAQEKGITGGIGNGLFGPNQPCTHAQIVTFLWRAAGSPVVNYAMNMSDVPEGSYYAEAVRWALSEGIATGTTGNTFSPDSECTRAQAVAFLFRYAASEAVTLQELVSGFSDADSVPGYALPAMNWALAEEIVQGNGSKLMPNDSCTRAQIVTFLFRAYQDK